MHSQDELNRAAQISGYDLVGKSTPSMLVQIPQYKVPLPFLGSEQVEQLVAVARAVREN